jgi:cell division protein FtsA
MKATVKSKGDIIAALDLGSSKIGCFIARIQDGGVIEVLGYGHQESRGIGGGGIVDLEQAEKAIRAAVHTAEHMAADIMHGYPLREVVVNVPASHTNSRSLSVDVAISGEEVTDHDVRRALARAQDSVNLDMQELVHTIPVTYTIDGQGSIREPRGMFGRALEVDIHMVSGDVSALRNMASAIQGSHLDIAALCASSYAAGLAVCVEDEMDLGCTVIDIGGGIASMAVFYGGALIYADAVQVGGKHVTRDIARGLTTSLGDAERIKTLYGSAITTSQDDTDMIEVPPLGEGSGAQPSHVPRSSLIGIIQPRLEEIFEQLRARLDDSGVAHMAGRRVILTGGGSQMPGICDLAQAILNKQVRLGRPIRLESLDDSVSGPAFAASAGLLIYLAERGHEMPADIMADAPPESRWARLKQWLKENW